MRRYQKKYKSTFGQNRNKGIVRRTRYRAISFQIILLLNKYKNEHGHVEVTPENYKELFEAVKALPELQGIEDTERRDVAVQKAIEFTIYKLFLNGDVTIGSIEKAECIMRHKDLIEGAEENKDFKAAITGNRDLMEVFNLIKNKEHPSHEDAGMFGVRLTQRKDGSKDAIMVGTGAECISAIRSALRVEMPQLLEDKKEEV